VGTGVASRTLRRRYRGAGVGHVEATLEAGIGMEIGACRPPDGIRPRRQGGICMVIGIGEGEEIGVWRRGRGARPGGEALAMIDFEVLSVFLSHACIYLLVVLRTRWHNHALQSDRMARDPLGLS